MPHVAAELTQNKEMRPSPMELSKPSQSVERRAPDSEMRKDLRPCPMKLSKPSQLVERKAPDPEVCFDELFQRYGVVKAEELAAEFLRSNGDAAAAVLQIPAEVGAILLAPHPLLESQATTTRPRGRKKGG